MSQWISLSVSPAFTPTVLLADVAHGKLLAQAANVNASSPNSAIFTFAIYMVGVMFLAWASNRLLQSKSFLSEYFLGSRSLGVWAFALTLAATSSSGGSFIGFPSLVYTHGWIVALWIGSYMIVPIVSMGLLAKRINQVARKTGAITIPDVLRDRFESPAFGSLATVLIVFFMSFNLIAQFKGGSVILNTLLEDVPLFSTAKDAVSPIAANLPLLSTAADNPGYLICLFVFAATVVVYTSYGGFRAVVWTDVMQGFVMVGGVVLMLPLALYAIGGLGNATKRMAELTPPNYVKLQLAAASPAEKPYPVPINAWFVAEDSGNRRVFRISQKATLEAGESLASVVPDKKRNDPTHIRAIELTSESSKAAVEPTSLAIPLTPIVISTEAYKRGAGRKGVYLVGPGPSAESASGFLPISLAVSFFFMWTFSGAGQPSNMVRLMAFQNSQTLRRAIFTVSVYYTLIYFPLVVIFCCARVLLPGWESEPDRVMPEMAKYVTAAINMPWLAGLLVAAPFAAVMSTMDSFLLMISSAVVRDIYQRNINPEASEKTIKRMTYATTVAVGAGAMLAAVNPPKFLQDIIVFTGSGLSTSFLAPVALSLYWPRFTKQGAIAGMLGGFGTHVLLYAIGTWMATVENGQFTMQEYTPLGFHPFLVGVAMSFTISIAAAVAGPRPPERLVRKFFYCDGK